LNYQLITVSLWPAKTPVYSKVLERSPNGWESVNTSNERSIVTPSWEGIEPLFTSVKVFDYQTCNISTIRTNAAGFEPSHLEVDSPHDLLGWPRYGDLTGGLDSIFGSDYSQHLLSSHLHSREYWTIQELIERLQRGRHIKLNTASFDSLFVLCF
jgi:hypothetical protein